MTGFNFKQKKNKTQPINTLVPEAIYGESEERSDGEENRDFSSPSLRSSLPT